MAGLDSRVSAVGIAGTTALTLGGSLGASVEAIYPYVENKVWGQWPKGYGKGVAVAGIASIPMIGAEVLTRHLTDYIYAEETEADPEFKDSIRTTTYVASAIPSIYTFKLALNNAVQGAAEKYNLESWKIAGDFSKYRRSMVVAVGTLLAQFGVMGITTLFKETTT